MRPDKLCEQNVNHLSSKAMLTAKCGSERNSLLLNNKWRNKLSNLLGIQWALAVMNVDIKPGVNSRWLWGMIFQSARSVRWQRCSFITPFLVQRLRCYCFKKETNSEVLAPYRYINIDIIQFSGWCNDILGYIFILLLFKMTAFTWTTFKM